MCGILGEFSFRGPARSVSLQTLAHRGPDAQGERTLSDGRLWMGHTRLAILDLSATGAQPMEDSATGNVIVFNGEIYNHLELRKRLPASENWRGTSDTETLLVAFREWGIEAFAALRGMYAFALWEARKRRLWLVRDPVGIKPLYFRLTGDSLHFASETRACRELAEAGRELDGRAIAHFLRFGALDESHLGLPGLRALEAGSWLCIEADGRSSEGTFWRPPQNHERVSLEEAIKGTRDRVVAAVERHLLADVPVASFLSGGLDSSIVSIVAARALNRPLQTFSVGFREREWDESEVAAEVARSVGAEHLRIELDEPALLEAVVAGVAAMDLPSLDGLNTYIVSQAVRQSGVLVALSGLGGDEFFGGYPVFQEFARWRWASQLPAWTRAMVRAMGARGRQMADLPLRGADVAAIADWRRALYPERELASMGLDVPTAAAFESAPGVDWMATLSWAEASRYMRRVLLRDSDQMSMAHSLELRVPLLDLDLVDWALCLPAEVKTVGNFNKPLLLEAFRRELPESVYNRPKRGFVLPLDRWMRGPLAAFVAEGVAMLKECQPGLVPAIERQEKAFAAGRLHWTRWWTFVVLGHWLGKVG